MTVEKDSLEKKTMEQPKVTKDSSEKKTKESSEKATVSVNDSVTLSARHDVHHSNFVALKEFDHNLFVDDDAFQESVVKAEAAIAAGKLPKLICEGCSGSYFVLDSDEKIIAVYKPKDEEPFADLNPKWPKFFQRILCFCCFGRACLIPNHGYLSETGASLVDERFQLNIVPKTRIVRLTSKSFNYGRRFGRKRKPKPKEGSFQLFVNGYKPAKELIAEWQKKPLPPDEEVLFIGLFQRLIVLDYIIRNTDRHDDNWLIRYVPGVEMSIAAIDNGLAFPLKHPEETSYLRWFRYGWADLSWAKLPWQEELRQTLLSKLNSTQFVAAVCEELKTLFRHDHTHNALLVHGQMRVLRGQMWNLRHALTVGDPPAELLRRPNLLVERRYGRNSDPPEDWAKAFRVKMASPLNTCLT